MTSYWARWRVKSPASRLFTQLLLKAQIKENIKAPCHWPLGGEFPAQKASNTETVSIWWRHHVGMCKETVRESSDPLIFVLVVSQTSRKHIVYVHNFRLFWEQITLVQGYYAIINSARTYSANIYKDVVKLQIYTLVDFPLKGPVLWKFDFLCC